MTRPELFHRNGLILRGDGAQGHVAAVVGFDGDQIGLVLVIAADHLSGPGRRGATHREVFQDIPVPIVSQASHYNAGVAPRVDAYHEAPERRDLRHAALSEQHAGPQGAWRIRQQLGMEFLAP